MSESAAVPESPRITIGKDGRRLTPESLERMRQGREAGRKAIIEAHALRRASLEIQQQPQETEHKYKSFALSLVPGILKRWGKGAMGRIKGWPAAAQLEAGKMILGVAGIALEARASGSGPLAEMSLQELQDSLAGSLDSVRNLIAIESQALQVPESIDDAKTVIDTAPTEGDPVPPAEPQAEAP